MVTAWPDEVLPRSWAFPLRNRWIAGLASDTVVVEAPHRSGALHTARAALSFGRTVWAVPGPIGADNCAGTNRLIRDGAHALDHVADFVGDLSGGRDRPTPREAWQTALFGGASLEEVARMRGESVGGLLRALQEMEATGVVVRLPGQRYAPG